MQGGELTIQEWNDQLEQDISEQEFRYSMCHGEATMHDLQLEDVEVAEVFLRVGQCWATAEQVSKGYMMEILVLDTDSVDFIQWHTAGGALVEGAVIKLEMDEFPLGAGTRTAHAEPHVYFVHRLNAEAAA
jgi:hypothetical protein